MEGLAETATPAQQNASAPRERKAQSAKTIEIPYRPREQFRAYHARHERWACIVAHRRAGKTVACINDDIRACLKRSHWRSGASLDAFRAAYVAPLLKQAKAVAWDYVKTFTGPIPGIEFNETELRADFPNGARYRLLGADNYDGMRGVYLDRVTMDEPADADPRAWSQVIRPALVDREGRGTFIGTPKGKNGFWEIHDAAQRDPNWFSLVLKASTTGILSSGELADAARSMSEDEYAQEFECSFEAALVGAYFGKEMREAEERGRICAVPHDRGALTYTAWDIGVSDPTAIWFLQVVGREYRAIDYYESTDMPVSHYADVLRKKPYRYERHYLPHDADKRDGGSAKSYRDQLEEALGQSVEICPQESIIDGIEAARRLIPQCVFDKTNCGRGVEALKQYRREFDEKLKSFRQRPLHDWASHGADAFRTFALNHKAPSEYGGLVAKLNGGASRPTSYMGM